MSEREVVCRELVEIVTDYLEGALDPELATRVEEHLVICGPCATYLAQMRQTSEALARLADDTPGMPPALRLAVREWSSS